MEKLKHVWPSIEYKEDCINYIKEHIECNSEIHGVGGLNRYLDNYEEWLIKLEEEKLIEPNEKLVPAETYLLVREEDNKVVGMINLRLTLNENLKKFGGHIGYGIRPSERRKGYNKINLYLILKRCSELGLNEVLLDCSDYNIGSSSTMKALGGEKVKEYYNEKYGNVHRYKINVIDSINKHRSIYEKNITQIKK